MSIKTIKVIVNCVFCLSIHGLQVYRPCLFHAQRERILCLSCSALSAISLAIRSRAASGFSLAWLISCHHSATQGAAVICAFFSVLCLVLRLNLALPRILLTSLGTTRIAWYVSPFFSRLLGTVACLCGSGQHQFTPMFYPKKGRKLIYIWLMATCMRVPVSPPL